jgi:sulfur carrier protein ThiS
MHVQLELYASLMKFLPPQAVRHRVSVEIESGSSVQALLERYQVPLEQAHLVLRNGVFLHSEERPRTLLQEGDVIAAWPPVAGG